jgi:type VI secretion system protein VasJ
MLGFLKSKTEWKWAACGKHPAAKDYFAFRVEIPLMMAFSQWVQRGYREFAGSNKKAYGQSSWRFWSRGTSKGELLCGLLKDSSDSIGRPYPLLVMGSGVIKGWENGWATLFQALGPVWNQMEQISSWRFDYLGRLEDAVANLPASVPNERDPKPAEPTGQPETQTARRKALQLAEERELWVFLDEGSTMDPASTARMWGVLLGEQGIGPPNALFVGGIPERHALALYKRSLNVSDFTRLWSLEDGEEL